MKTIFFRQTVTKHYDNIKTKQTLAHSSQRYKEKKHIDTREMQKERKEEKRKQELKKEKERKKERKQEGRKEERKKKEKKKERRE